MSKDPPAARLRSPPASTPEWSAQDKFVVRDALTADTVWWDNNKAMDQRKFEVLLADMQEHARGRDLYVQDSRAAPMHRTPSGRVIPSWPGTRCSSATC